MRIDNTSRNYVNEVRAMRAQYLHGLLLGGMRAVLASVRSVGRFLTRRNTGRARDSAT